MISTVLHGDSCHLQEGFSCCGKVQRSSVPSALQEHLGRLGMLALVRQREPQRSSISTPLFFFEEKSLLFQAGPEVAMQLRMTLANS